jgi:hypothetical protein
MAAMISASDVLQVLSEIHQYSIVLIELKEATTIGISHSSDGKLNYFAIARALGSSERARLVREIYSGKTTEGVNSLSMEQFLLSVEGKKPRHIWLETGGTERKELGFMSIAELKAHLRIHAKRQH